MSRWPAENDLFVEPDIKGLVGSAWLVDMAVKRKRPDEESCLSAWQVTVPGAHPLWHSYVISVIHLRSIPGVRDAMKSFPDATHEVNVLALDPNYLLKDPKNYDSYSFRMLLPPNLTVQFHGISDGQAQGLARALAKEFCDGRLSPDTDDRTSAIRYVMEYVRRFAP